MARTLEDEIDSTPLNTDRFRLFSRLSEKCGIEPVQLSAARPSPTIAHLLDAGTARRFQIVPLHKSGAKLTVAFGDPMDIETIDTLRRFFREPLKVVAALPEQIRAALDRLYPRNNIDTEKEPQLSPKDDRAILTEQRNDEPLIKLVNLLIFEAVKQRASDIHFEPFAGRFRVRYRIDGVLCEIEAPPIRLYSSIVSRIKIMSGMNITEKRLPQDGRMAIRTIDRDLDMRVSSIPTNHGESIVIRILDKEQLARGLPNLGLYPENQKTFKRLIQYPDGLLLITGPTGSGKTTTLYACLHHLNQSDRKIITVEDPVEYQLGGVNQVQVHPRIGLTFAAALRSILRQAPNIIMIGEIRDAETARIAVNAALTGHLVLSTLHTNDAPSAVTRLIDVGVKSYLLSSCLRGIIAQRLVRTVCEHCKYAYQPSETETRLLGGISILWKGTGCTACGHTGYFGRKGIFELMTINDAIRKPIYQGTTSAELRVKTRAAGMRTLREDGFRKAAEGLTTLNEVLRVTMKEVSR